MSTQYFYKELVSNAYLVGGAAVPFEVLDGNRGVIALDDNSPLLPALNDAAANHRGGIIKISEAQYTEKKTAHPLSLASESRLGLGEKLRIVPTRRAPFASRGPAVVEASPAETSSAPAINLSPGVHPGGAVVNGEAQQAMASPPKFTPATRRISRAKAAEGETA